MSNWQPTESQTAQGRQVWRLFRCVRTVEGYEYLTTAKGRWRFFWTVQAAHKEAARLNRSQAE